MPEDEKECQECGKPLVIRIKRDISRKRFCSQRCLGLWSARTDPERTQKMLEAGRLANKLTKEERRCEHCGCSYFPTSNRQKWCSECVPDKKARRVIQHYGISWKEREGMYNEQDGMCVLCEHRQAEVVDHDHETGKVRGLLCHRCNTILHEVEDSEWLERALEYVSRDE